MKRLFTSESVTEGHPDKICDQISDAILDEALMQDAHARVACETFVTTGLVSIMGEITTNAYIDFQKVAREVIRRIGYTNDEYGFSADSCGIICSIDSQSSDINLGTNDDVGGAGDQGIMFGYACDETEELMPAPIYYASRLAQRLDHVRHHGVIPYLRPDGKTQVTVEYDDDKVVRIDTIVVSAQHNPDIPVQEIKDDIIEHVIKPVIPEELLDGGTQIFVNPTGRFVIGGPHGDTGLTGRKIIVDTYGGMARHGGGCFSGKDATKVDRSASYMARYVAKQIVAEGLAKKCEIQLGYAIGMAEPISIYVNTFGTGEYRDDELARAVRKIYNFTPHGIINKFGLQRPIFEETACYGHFGDPSFPWELIDDTGKNIRNILSRGLE